VDLAFNQYGTTLSPRDGTRHVYPHSTPVSTFSRSLDVLPPYHVVESSPRFAFPPFAASPDPRHWWNFEHTKSKPMQICRCIRGQGPPALSLRQVDHVPDETQAARYEREKEQIRQVARIQDDHRPRLLLSSPRATTTKATTTATASTRARAQQPGNMQVLGRGATRFGIPGRKEDTGHDREADGNSSTSGALPPRKLVTLASYTGRMATGEASNGNGNSDGFGIAMPPASLGKSCPIRRPVSLSRDGDTDADRARAVAAVPYPTLRSLRKS